MSSCYEHLHLTDPIAVTTVVNLCFTRYYRVYLGKAISPGLKLLTLYSIHFKILIKLYNYQKHVTS